MSLSAGNPKIPLIKHTVFLHKSGTQSRNQKPVIIWDVGGVILDWNPTKFAETHENGAYKDICIQIFTTENWKKFDRGDLCYADLVNIYSEKFKLSKDTINNILQSAFHSLKPNWQVINLIITLKNAGFEQYCLTNGSKEYLNYVTGEKYKKAYNFSLSELFKDSQIILSAAINCSKPEAKIYQYTEKFFKVSNKKIIFIDDSQPNIEGANKAGWSGIHFTAFNDFIRELNSFGVLGQVSSFHALSKL